VKTARHFAPRSSLLATRFAHEYFPKLTINYNLINHNHYSITQPRIHAVVFDPATGKLVPLKVDFRQYIDELHDIYDLYAIEDETKVDAANKEALSSLKKGEQPHLPGDIDVDVGVGKRNRWKFWKK
jgi:hypothetical protein